MAHELTIRSSGKAEMAYAGETPWHGLGQPVTLGASIGVWQREAGMDWDALECSLQSAGAAPNPIHFPAYKGIVRGDTLEPLSIVGSNYQLVQPKEVLEFFRDLTEDGGWHIHTAGTLRGGRKLWAMAGNGQRGAVGKKGSDEVRMNLLLATSLDGSMKTQAMLTSVRVVCANTLALALQENGEHVRISHRSVFDPSAIKRALGVAEESFDAFMRKARQMADAGIDLSEARAALREIFGVKPPQQNLDLSWMTSKLSEAATTIGEEEQQDARSVDRCMQLFEGAGMGANLSTSLGTRWGLFNAVTEHVDHEMGKTKDTRLDNAWFGRGNKFKQEALELLAC